MIPWLLLVVGEFSSITMANCLLLSFLVLGRFIPETADFVAYEGDSLFALFLISIRKPLMLKSTVGAFFDCSVGS